MSNKLFNRFYVPTVVTNLTGKYERIIRKSRIAETLKTWPAKGRLWVSFSMPPIVPSVDSDDWDDMLCTLIDIRDEKAFWKIWDRVVESLESHHDRGFGWISRDLFFEKVYWKYVHHFYYAGESHVLMQFYIKMDDEFYDEWRETVCGECSRGVKTDVDVFCEDHPKDCSSFSSCDPYDYSDEHDISNKEYFKY